MKHALPQSAPMSHDRVSARAEFPEQSPKSSDDPPAPLRKADSRLMSSKRDFSWDDLKYFLALVRTGNPTSAARGIKADHTTVRRRISALEAALQTHLFSSHGGDYELTAEGDRLLKYAEEMESLSGRIEEEIANSDSAISGTVRIGAPDGFGSYFLAPRLPLLASTYPGLAIQLVILPRVINLSNREADVAVALSVPDQNRQIVRKLIKYKLHIYGSKAYLDANPPITAMADLSGHRFIGYIPDLIYTPELDYLPESTFPLQSSFESTSVIAQVQAASAGYGLMILPTFIATSDRALQPVLPELFCLEREFWLVIHPESVNLTRVRAVIDFITEQTRREKALFSAASIGCGNGNPLGR
jgi:DNA-binding transcriptional LysR family regulator